VFHRADHNGAALAYFTVANGADRLDCGEARLGERWLVESVPGGAMRQTRAKSASSWRTNKYQLFHTAFRRPKNIEFIGFPKGDFGRVIPYTRP
jgi:hypothetical protein